jgi:hypothetical protein
MPNLLVLAFAVLIVAGGVFFIAVVAQGVPISWLQGQLRPLSGLQSTFKVSVSPEVPWTTGETITVTVNDAQTLKPVEGASVDVSKDGAHLVDLTTDVNGRVQFEYPGETTIIVVSKAPDYTSAMKVLPRVPDAWLQAVTNGLIVATISGVVSGVLVAWITRRT